MTTNPRNANREHVYNVIDGERDYQDAFKGNAKPHTNRVFPTPEVAGSTPPMQTGGFILCIEECLAQARAAWYRPDGGEACLPFIRKVTALGVAMLEHYGAPPREGHEPETATTKRAVA